MKNKMISLLLALVLCVMCIVPAAASESKAALYQSYKTLVEQVNEKYGYSLELLPISEADTSYSVAEFKKILEDYCEYKANAVTVEYVSESMGRGVVLVPCVVTKQHNIATVSVTFNGLFDIRQRANGSYYVYSASFTNPTAVSNNPVLYYTYNGSLNISFLDGGRTRKVSQGFSVYVANAVTDYVTVSAFYYFNSVTGQVDSQAW